MLLRIRIHQIIFKSFWALLTVMFFKNWLGLLLGFLLQVTPEEYVIRGRNTNHIIIKPLGHYYGAFVHLAYLMKNGWKVTPISEELLLLDKGVLRLYCRQDIGSDITELKEVFVDEVYKSELESKVVIDVGMSSGNSSIYFSYSGASLVIGIEPNKESYQLALQNFELNNVRNVRSYNALLAPLEEKRRIQINPKSGYVEKVYNLEGARTDLIYTITMNKVVEENNLTRIDFLKMDCEGCEYEFFGKVSDEILDSIGTIFLEYHEGIERILSERIRERFNYENFTRSPSGELGMLVLKRKTLIAGSSV